MAKDSKGFTERERPRQLLRDVVISRIEPSSISEHPKFLYPSVYYMLTLDTFFPSFLLYRMDSTDPSTFSNFTHAGKNSLSQVLSFYYPMAGKWIVADDAWTRKLVCNDEGPVFVEAAVDDEMDNVLDRDDFNPPVELTGVHAVPGLEDASIYKTSKTKEYPALIVQVTRFKCGGVALALTFNHMSMDGFAFDRFVKAWSEILSTGQTSAKPVFDRSMVVSHMDKNHILGIPLDSENRDDVFSSYFRLAQSEVRENHNICKFFSVRKDPVERLRQKAKEEHVSDINPERPEQFTTFECVCAQLWRCCARIPKVLGVTSGEDMVMLLFPVEGRRKWSNPPLPEDYVGNMFMLTGPPILPGPEITDKPFSFAACHVHESIVNINHETCGGILDEMLKGIKEAGRSTEETLETEKPDNHKSLFQLVVTSWSRFDNFYNLDFGYGGPFFLCPFSFWMPPNGVVVFLVCPPPKSENAVELYLRGPPEYINILLEDPEFVSLVS